MASGQFVNPLSVVPAVVAPPLQTQLHHRGGVVVSHATPNGNPVNCQSNMEPQGGCAKCVCVVSCKGRLGCVLKYQVDDVGTSGAVAQMHAAPPKEDFREW